MLGTFGSDLVASGTGVFTDLLGDFWPLFGVVAGVIVFALIWGVFMGGRS